MRAVVIHYDCKILCGHRPEAEQTTAFEAGNSKVAWPNSKHNKLPSEAVDAVPYPVPDWDSLHEFYRFIWFVRGCAAMLGIDIRVGADWDGDFDITDQQFNDLPHIELVRHRGDY